MESDLETTIKDKNIILTPSNNFYIVILKIFL